MSRRRNDPPLDPHRSRVIVGLSLPPSVVSQFKAEAARRKTTLRELFLEIWNAYQSRSSGDKKS